METANLFYDNDVAVNLTGLKNYPSKVPFHPPERYPEYQGSEIDPDNLVYKGVRDLFIEMGLDKENLGTPKWNPLGGLIRPGMQVFLKPNTVRHYHLANKEFFSIVVHGAVIRPLLDYVCIALKGEGRIILGDSQVLFGEFDKAIKRALIDDLLEWYRKQTSIPLNSMDLRIVRGVRTYMYGKWGRQEVRQDPRGYTWVNLGEESAFKDIDPKRLRIGYCSYKKMYKHHSEGRHEYLIPNSYLESDVVINVPKFKTHRRTCITLAQKNFFGIPALKDSLPHFITGSPSEGGDQYINPSLRKRIVLHLHDIIQSSPYVPVKFVTAILKKLLWNTHKIYPFKDNVYEAMWHGNDTLWRTLLDLNKVALFADKKGKMQSTPQRGHFCVMDGIIGGEKEGPVSPDPVYPGLLIAGYNPLALDIVGGSIMGFDINKIPIISNTLKSVDHKQPLFKGGLDDIKVLNEGERYGLETLNQKINLGFQPHPTWVGHVERAA